MISQNLLNNSTLSVEQFLVTLSLTLFETPAILGKGDVIQSRSSVSSLSNQGEEGILKPGKKESCAEYTTMFYSLPLALAPILCMEQYHIKFVQVLQTRNNSPHHFPSFYKSENYHLHKFWAKLKYNFGSAASLLK